MKLSYILVKNVVGKYVHLQLKTKINFVSCTNTDKNKRMNTQCTQLKLPTTGNANQNLQKYEAGNGNELFELGICTAIYAFPKQIAVQPLRQIITITCIIYFNKFYIQYV